MTIELVTIEQVRKKGYLIHEGPSTLPANLSTAKRFDQLTPFRNGKAWTFELMRETQPLTWQTLSAASDLKLARYTEFDYDIRHLLLVVNSAVVEVCRDLYGLNPSDPGYREEKDRVTRHLTEREGKPTLAFEGSLSLPEPIRLAYYTRIDGLNLPRDVPWGMETRLLPRPTFNWNSIDAYLQELRLRKKYLPLVEEMIPGIRPKRKSDPYTDFQLFLDTRPTLWGKGDVFFVKNHIQDGVIYYIRDGDIPNMMILADPATAIDRYCAHILTGTDVPFDFMPYTVPFT